MRKAKKLYLLFKLTWKICPYLYFSTLLDSMLSVAQTLIYVFMPKYIIDALVTDKAWTDILLIITVYIGFIAAVKIINLLTCPWVNSCTNRSGIDTLNHYMELSAHTQYSIFETAEYRNNFQSVMSMVRGETAADFCAAIVSAGVSLLIYTVYIASLNPIILLIVLLVVVSNTVVKMRLNRLEEKTIPDFKRNSREFSYINDTFSNFDNAKEVRINQCKELFNNKYNENIWERWKLNTSYGRKKFLLNMCLHIADAIQLVSVYGYAGYMTWNGLISFGSFTVYAASVINFSNAFSKLVNAVLDVGLAVRFVPRYCEIKTLAQESDSVDMSWRADRPLEIKFENVSFRYPNTSQMVLENINLTISDGCKLAIVGENGAGKTTFIKLLCRLYSPTSGQITLNGINIENIPREIYAGLLSVVFQDYKLFSFDVVDNIVLNSKLEEEKLVDVIGKSDLRSKIDSLPNGIHTYINREFDEHGVEFSGGEMQRLALARAYYKGSPIVILDEPTGALNRTSSNEVMEELVKLNSEGTTIMLVTHDVKVAAKCTRVMYIVDGNIKGEYDLSDCSTQIRERERALNNWLLELGW